MRSFLYKTVLFEISAHFHNASSVFDIFYSIRYCLHVLRKACSCMILLLRCFSCLKLCIELLFMISFEIKFYDELPLPVYVSNCIRCFDFKMRSPQIVCGGVCQSKFHHKIWINIFKSSKNFDEKLS